MIMQRLRSVTKYFMWFVAAAFILFIFFGFGSNILSGRRGDENLIAEVNGEPITYREYGDLLNNQTRIISGSMGVNPVEERKLSDQIINGLIMDRLLNEQLNKRDISISDEQIIDIIKNSPPSMIAQDTTFWVGGKFDYNRYLELLKDPRASRFISDYAAQIKGTLPKRILQGEISSLVGLTNNGVAENLMEDSVRMKLEYIRLPLDEWMGERPSTSPEEFYLTHKDIFTREGDVRLDYVSFPIQVDKERIQSAKDLAESIIKRAENVPFDTLVSIYSYLPSNRRLFNGWVNVKNLSSDFITALVGRKTGEITYPIGLDDGYHILKLLDRQRDSLNLKEIFLAVFPSEDGYKTALGKSWELVKQLRSDSTTGGPEGYDVKHTECRIGYVPDIPIDFGTFLDDPKKGAISYPLIGNDSLYVCWVEDIEEGTPFFSEIKAEVRDSLELYEAASRAKEYLEKKLTGDELPRHPGKGKWSRTPYFTLNNYQQKGVRLPEKIVLLSFNLKVGKVSPAIRGGESVFVIKVLDRKTPSKDKIKEFIPEFARNLQLEKQMIFYQEWLYELRKRSEIKDLREKLYEYE